MNLDFTIDGIEYSVPDVITTEVFSKASVWDISDPKNMIPFVSVITDCPIFKLKLMDVEVFEVVLAACATKLNLENDTPVTMIMGQHLIDLETITFGQFMDFDIFTADGPAKHVVTLVSKLYGITEDMAAKLDINKVWPAVLNLVEWRKIAYAEHSEFFEVNSSDEPGDSKEFTMSDLQLMWYNATLVLAEHKFLNINAVVERPYKEALNFLTWKKNEASEQRLKQLKQKHDLQKRTR